MLDIVALTELIKAKKMLSYVRLRDIYEFQILVAVYYRGSGIYVADETHIFEIFECSTYELITDNHNENNQFTGY